MNKNRQLWLLAASIFVGIAFPALAAILKPFLFPLIFLLFLCAMLQVSFSDAAQVMFKDKASWITLVWQLLILPFLFYVCLKPILPTQLHTFAVVSMCAGAITATTALARMFNLNSTLSLVVCLSAAVLMPLPLFLFLRLLLGADAQIDLSVYSIRIAIFILLPFIIVFLIRKWITPQSDLWIKQQMPTAVLILLMLFGLSVMDGVGDLMFSDPIKLLSYVLLAFGISLGVQLLTYAALYFLGRCDAATGAMLCAYRNMGLAAAITGSSLGEDFFIFLGVWQLPMYILPLVLRKAYEARGTVIHT